MTLLHHNTFNPWSDADRLFGTLRNEASWAPAFDIEETDAAYVLRGDIPGMPQKDIEVRIEDGVLSLRGERKPPEAPPRFSRRERPHGKFLRRFGCRMRSTRMASRRPTSMVSSSSPCRSASRWTPPA